MSDVFDNLPWYKRWRTHIGLAMPRWYQLRYNRRKFWQHIEEGTTDKDPWACMCRAMAAAELNRRLGDNSLADRIHDRKEAHTH